MNKPVLAVTDTIVRDAAMAYLNAIYGKRDVNGNLLPVPDEAGIRVAVEAAVQNMQGEAVAEVVSNGYGGKLAFLPQETPLGTKLYLHPDRTVVPDELPELLAKWCNDASSASPFNKKDLRPSRFIRDVEALLAGATSTPATEQRLCPNERCEDSGVCQASARGEMERCELTQSQPKDTQL